MTIHVLGALTSAINSSIGRFIIIAEEGQQTLGREAELEEAGPWRHAWKGHPHQQPLLHSLSVPSSMKSIPPRSLCQDSLPCLAPKARKLPGHRPKPLRTVNQMTLSSFRIDLAKFILKTSLFLLYEHECLPVCWYVHPRACGTGRAKII